MSLCVAEHLGDTLDKRKMHRQFPDATQQGQLRVMRTGRQQPGVSHSSSVVAQHQQHFFDRVAAVFGATQAVLRNRRHVHGLA